MAEAEMPEEFFKELRPHLPPEPPVGPQGGRPRSEHRVVMKVIWFVLVTGCRGEDVPRELGCSGRTAHRRLRVRYDRLAVIRDAWSTLAAAVICFQIARHDRIL